MSRSELSFDYLKAKQRSSREGFPPDFGLRIHRAISWLGRSESEEGDDAARFLFLWIAFNAAYADERGRRDEERDAFRDFFEQLQELDAEHRIYNSVWERFPASIRMFLENRFVFAPFWAFHNGVAGYENWEDRFAAAKRAFNQAIIGKRTALGPVFS